MQLSIALPCYNEEQNVRATVADVLQWFKNAQIEGVVIAVNDGSADQTGAILDELAAQHSNVIALHHKQNRGYGAAVTTGCDAAQTEWVAFMDSDGQFKAEDFAALIPYIGEYDFITGRRLKRADPFMRKVNAKLFGFLTFAVLGVWVRDINCAMKLFRRSTWQTVRPRIASGALINAEIFYRLKQASIPWKQVSVQHYPRLHGQQTGAKLSVILRMFRELFQLRRGAVAKV